MKKGDEQRLPRLNCRLIKEYDFFDEKRSGPSNYYVVPALKSPLKEIIFPQIFILNSGSSSGHERKRKATRVDDGDRESDTSEHQKKRQRSPNSHEEDECGALVVVPPPPPPPPPPPMEDDNDEAGPGLVEPVLLIEKKLELSDVKQSQNRLLITGSERLMAALTEEERERVLNQSVAMEVMTRDPRGAEFRMRLKRWPAMNAIVLNYEWFKLVSANGFQKGDFLQGWGYRAGAPNRFRLNINKIDPIPLNN